MGAYHIHILQNELESASEVNKILRDIKIFGKKEYIDSLESRMARLAIKYRLNMTRLSTNYKAANTNMCCPLCKREEDNYEHITKCSEYMDKWTNGQNPKAVRSVQWGCTGSEATTEAIKECMDYRCAQLDSWDCRDSREWRRDLRKKENIHMLQTIVNHIVLWRTDCCTIQNVATIGSCWV